MVKVKYVAKENNYKVSYKDFLAEKTGNGVVYVRKQFSAGKSKPSDKEKKDKLEYYKAWATNLEELTKKQADSLVNGISDDLPNSIDLPVLAVPYLESVTGNELTTSTADKQKKDAQEYLNSFINFLKDKHPQIHLHKITKQVVIEFIGSLEKKSYSYKHNRWVRCGYVFKRIVDKFEDSELNYRNPFHSLSLKSLTPPEPVKHKKVLKPEMIREVLKEAKEISVFKRGQTGIHKFQRWAILFLLTLTGIRPIDIFSLKWEQIDLDRRTLTIQHKKTQKIGLNTVIWLTPHLMELFITLKELHKKHKSCSKEFVFSFLPMNSKVTNEIEKYIQLAHRNDLNDFFKLYREKYNLKTFKQADNKRIFDYSTYSLRSSVASILSWEKFNKNMIDYLQGHSVKNVTSEFYIDNEQNPKEATAKLINHMAYRVAQQKLGKIGLQYAYQDAQEEAKEKQIQKEIDEQIERIESGADLLLETLLEKLDEEQEARNKMIDGYGKEISEFLKEH